MSDALRPCRPEDLDTVVRLHGEELPGGFFPRLGPRFLHAYHTTFLDGPYGVSLVEEQDGAVVGFVVGSTDAAAHGSWTVRERGLRLALVGARALLTRPAAAREFLTTRVGRYVRGLRRRLRRTRPGRVPSGAPGAAPARGPAVLTHVAVAAGVQGRGHGARLVDRFVAGCRDAGADEVRLVTDAHGAAVRFYERQGWERLAERAATDGRTVVEFRLGVHPPA